MLWRKTEGPKVWNVICYPEVLHRTRFWVSVCPSLETVMLLRHCFCMMASPSASAWGQSKEEAREQLFFPPQSLPCLLTALVRLGSSRAASRAGRAGSRTCCAETWKRAPPPSPEMLEMLADCAGHLAGHTAWVSPYVRIWHRPEFHHATAQAL